MITIQRLTKVIHVLKLWPFFTEGFAFVGRYRKYSLTLDSFRRALSDMVVAQATSWVGVAFSEGEPTAFWCATEITPPYATQREFEVNLRYHKQGRIDDALAVQAEFDLWCKGQNIARYFIATQKENFPDRPKFPSQRYGLKRAYTVFKKEL